MTLVQHLLISTLSALLLSATLATTANAHRGIGIEGERRITATEGSLVFNEPLGENAVTCPITLEGTLAVLIRKVHGEHVGSVTNGRVAEASCRDSNPSATIVLQLRGELFPWLLTYLSIRGTLPNIVAIVALLRLLFAVSIRVLGFEVAGCRYGGNQLPVTAEGNPVTNIRTNETTQNPLLESTGASENCPTELSLRSNFGLRRAIRLILQT